MKKSLSRRGRGDAGGLPSCPRTPGPLLHFTAYILALLRSARTSQVAGCSRQCSQPPHLSHPTPPHPTPAWPVRLPVSDTLLGCWPAECCCICHGCISCSPLHLSRCSYTLTPSRTKSFHSLSHNIHFFLTFSSPAQRHTPTSEQLLQHSVTIRRDMSQDQGSAMGQSPVTMRRLG